MPRRRAVASLLLQLVAAVAWLAAAGRLDADAGDGVAEEEVRAAFEAYRAALLARDGEAAAGLVTEASLAYHERLRDLALRADAGTVAAHPLADRLAVLRLRHELTAPELAPLSGRDLVALGVGEGWGDPRALASLRVRAVEAPDAAGKGAGEEATALVAVDGADAIPYRFRREAGRWRLDLARLARDAEPALARSLAALAERAGLDDGRAVLVLAVQSGSGHLVERDLWAPLLPAGDR